MGEYYFLTSCVGWSGRGRNPNPGADIQRMVDGARDINRGKFCGMPVYYFVWSAIEHIFMRIPDIRRVLG